jgi:hypothetical protein
MMLIIAKFMYGSKNGENQVNDIDQCTRYHIDEYDEYYSNYLDLVNKNEKMHSQVQNLQREILNLK